MHEGKILLGLVSLVTTVIVLVIVIIEPGLASWPVAVLLGLMALIMGGLLIYFIPKYIDGDWMDRIDTSLFEFEKIDVPMADGWDMVVQVAWKRGIGPDRRPAIICHHGSGGSKERVFHFGLPLALAGYVVFFPDARGHGESAPRNKNKKTNHQDDWWITPDTGIIPDVRRIIDAVERHPRVDPGRIGMIGHSMGALATFAGGVPDPRIKVAVAMSGIFSFKALLHNPLSRKFPSKPWLVKQIARFSFNFKKLEALEKQVSPKYYFEKMLAEGRESELKEKLRVIHAIDDELVLFDHSFALMQEMLRLPEDHVLVLKRGEHGLHAQETLVTARVLSWFDEVLRR